MQGLNIHITWWHNLFFGKKTQPDCIYPMSCTLTGLHTTHLQKPPLCQFSRTGQYCTALKMASYQDITIKTYNTKTLCYSSFGWEKMAALDNWFGSWLMEGTRTIFSLWKKEKRKMTKAKFFHFIYWTSYLIIFQE